MTIKPLKKSFDATISDISADKSISHRAIIFALLSDKASKIKNLLKAKDTLSTLKIAKQLGAKIKQTKNTLTIKPPKKIKEPSGVLDCGNSGTAMRLFIGFLATKKGTFILDGDKYLALRPMRRVLKPLNDIGAEIKASQEGEFCPIYIRGKKLKSFDYKSDMSSAQVKSAMILAALNIKKQSIFCESHLSRDHSENILKGMGTDIKIKHKKLFINPPKKALKPLNIHIPADPSSGFFFAVLVALIKDSKLVLKNVLLNKTRIEAYKVLKKMGLGVKFKMKSNKYEKIGDIYLSHAPLKAIKIDKNISWLIDEIPALAIAFAHAKGVSEIKKAKELRVKESDRIKSIVVNLRKCGIKVQEFDDGFKVVGANMKKAKVQSFGDHRIAMSFAIAGLKCGMQIDDVKCIETSFPSFFDIIDEIRWK